MLDFMESLCKDCSPLFGTVTCDVLDKSFLRLMSVFKSAAIYLFDLNGAMFCTGGNAELSISLV